MYVEESGVISQPAEKVFDYVADPMNLPQWSGAAVEVRDLKQRVPDRPGEGDRFTPVHKFLGQCIEEHVEVTAYEPNRHIKLWSSGGPMPLEINYIFEEVSGGARLTITMNAQPAGFFRMIGPVFGIAVKRQIRNDLKTLKELLEKKDRSLPVTLLVRSPPLPGFALRKGSTVWISDTGWRVKVRWLPRHRSASRAGYGLSKSAGGSPASDSLLRAL